MTDTQTAPAPGPWHMRETGCDAFFISDNAGNHLFLVNSAETRRAERINDDGVAETVYWKIPVRHAEAVARLATAAPKLLAAAKEYFEANEDYAMGDSRWVCHAAAFDRATKAAEALQAAVAEAEGRTP